MAKDIFTGSFRGCWRFLRGYYGVPWQHWRVLEFIDNFEHYIWPWDVLSSRHDDVLGPADSANMASTIATNYAAARNFPDQGRGVFFGCIQVLGLLFGTRFPCFLGLLYLSQVQAATTRHGELAHSCHDCCCQAKANAEGTSCRSCRQV